MKIVSHIIILLFCCISIHTEAQETRLFANLSSKEQRELEKILNAPVQHKYKFWDNLFFGGSVGINYSMSEYVRKEKFLNMLRPQVDLWLGKHISVPVCTSCRRKPAYPRSCRR